MTPSCGTGEACDVEQNSGLFFCFAGPNDAGPGGACDNQNGPFCQHGLACNAGSCAYFCCDASDCTGTCDTLGMVGNVEVKLCS